MTYRTLNAATALALVMGLATGLPAHAQDASGQQAGKQTTGQQAQGQPINVVALEDWSYDEFYSGGWSAEELLDEADVIGKTGEEIGDIENILIGPKGDILSVIAEVGGFWDIGDSHVSVPWDQVTVGPDLDSITLPVTQENVEDYSLFGEWGYITKPETGTTEVVYDDLATGPRIWKATDLIDDYAFLEGGVGYGYIDDLIFNDKGTLQAVVVDPDVIYGPVGPYAFPYHGYAHGWYPGYPYYALPYGESDVADLEPFDYDRMDSRETASDGTAGSQDQGSGTVGEQLASATSG